MSDIAEAPSPNVPEGAAGTGLDIRSLGQILYLGGIGVAALGALLWLLAQWNEGGAGEAVDASTGTITLSLGGEPPQLDSTRGTDAVSFNILGHTMEGLLRYDPDNRLEAGVAERWEKTGDTMVTFHLRPNARWSNGEPVTAHDFVFSWRKVLDPANASEYAFILYGLKNAEAINNGTMPVESLEVHALDDRTLEVHLERPVPYFDKLVAFATYNPISEAFYESREGRYAADAEDLLYNGPFTISSWVHGASIRLEKNPHYWDADNIRLNAIDYAYFTTDPNATINLFKDNKTALAGLVAENLDDALQRRWKIKRFSDGAVFFMEFNHREDRLTRNYHLRKAIQAVNDSPELVYRIIKLPGNLPGASLFPVWLKGVDGYFRQEYPLTDPLPDDELGRRHLATAMAELALSEPPTLVMLIGDSPTAKKQAEYYQNLYKQKLGIDIRIDAQIFKQRLAKMTAGDFDIVMAGWGPDYDDPMTFADLFASWNENNRGRFNNPELDEAVNVARSSSDPETRMDAMARVQQILFDEAAIVVNYERGSVYVSHPRLKGIVRRAVGTDPDYTRAWIE
ncbi:MAG: peptide ABC transporter substrate-binding protein [Pseudomonadales bacterium]|nr:peptide ABC transporter substrate-binding protein [Pseudomonadales bacterium]